MLAAGVEYFRQNMQGIEKWAPTAPNIFLSIHYHPSAIRYHLNFYFFFVLIEKPELR
jgi:hypothetical protein